MGLRRVQQGAGESVLVGPFSAIAIAAPGGGPVKISSTGFFALSGFPRVSPTRDEFEIGRRVCLTRVVAGLHYDFCRNSLQNSFSLIQ